MHSDEIRLRAAGPADAAEISALSLTTFGPELGTTPEIVAETIANWREMKAPIVVAREAERRFLGYALSAPNIVNGFGRVDGQVAVLTHVAVEDDARSRGVGAALVARTVKTLAMLGYSRAVAQIPGELVRWYEHLGWSVGPDRQSKAWVEPHIPQDDQWHPEEFEPGEFSPILLMDYLPRYPHLAEITIGPAAPLVEATFTLATNGEESMQRAGDAIGQELARHPELASQLPSALVELLSENRRLPVNVRQMLCAALEA